MTKEQAARLVAALATAYPRQQLTEETVKLYAQFLSEMDYSLAQEAVKRLIATSTFFPTIAEIRRTAAEMGLNLPSASEAWSEIISHQDCTPWSCEFVRDMCYNFGGLWTFRHSDNTEMLRHQFVKQYDEEKERHIREVQTRPALMASERKALPEVSQV